LFQQVFAGQIDEVMQTNSYDKLLPSFTAWADITDDFVVRFAASKSLTRPQLTDLAPRVNIDVTRPSNLLASGGNPNLKPFVSDNFDLSFEWYFREASFLTLGLFYKQVDDFIVSAAADEAFPIANADAIPEFLPNNEAIFSVRRPRNAESARVRGLEISGQVVFDMLPSPFDGLGLTANATFVSSNAELNTGAITQTFALEGLGNSQNVVGFYEKGPVEFRVAYNRRAAFMQTLVAPVGGDPVFVKTFDQIDVRGSYTFLERYSVFFEGINITKSKTQKHGRFENQITKLENTGARYAFGVRAEF
ncbi:MAG: TonB-dependent receptor, partial [Alphaproteobacteria bacterium]